MLFFFAIFTKPLYYYSQMTAGEYYINLTAGVYNVSCYGAQGGGSYIGGSTSTRSGGKGALASGILTVTGDGVAFWGYIGSQGNRTSKSGPNAGGSNGGGWGGQDYNSLTFYYGNDAPGGGGGATELRFNDNNFDSRIIVGAGGSGAAYMSDGAPGGDTYGYYMTSNNVYAQATGKVTQSLGSADGKGGNGTVGAFIPGSGGGGGWRGGPGGSNATGDDNSYLAVGYSGSSYISGHPGCTKNSRLSFSPTKMIIGRNTGNGWIRISQTYECPNNCYKCSTSGCITCYEPFFVEEGKCVEKCSDGFYANQNKHCYTCNSNCKTCDINSTHCTSCDDNRYFYNGKCLEKCDDGFYAYDGKCLKCPYSCKTCESKDKCTACIDKRVLHDNQCLLFCPPGTAKVGDSCERCESHCESCHPSVDVCTSCEENFYLHESKCVESCPNGTIAMGSHCVDCKSPCDECFSTVDNCTSCIDNFYLYKNTCVGHCPSGTTLIGLVCEECTNPCATCSSSVDHCLTCVEGFYLYENKCYSECSDLNVISASKFFGKNDEEQACSECKDRHCINCSENYSRCEICEELYYSVDGVCIIKPTNVFTGSSAFSSSSPCKESAKFSSSSPYTESKKFSGSSPFTESAKFSGSSPLSRPFSDYDFLFSKEQTQNGISQSPTLFSNTDLKQMPTDDISNSQFSSSDNFFADQLSSEEHFESSQSLSDDQNSAYGKFSSNEIITSDKQISVISIYVSNSQCIDEYSNNQLNYPFSPNKKKGLNMSVLIGIVIACIILVLIITFLLVYLFVFKRKKGDVDSIKENANDNSHETQTKLDNQVQPEEEDDDDDDLLFWL